ncbi:MAG: hypothetical protein O8C65_12320 [Candidatus Methanoperedens sp.]|nr:hypothetical protein [Candidatus Methanoperedens sp.]
MSIRGTDELSMIGTKIEFMQGLRGNGSNPAGLKETIKKFGFGAIMKYMKIKNRR